MEERREFQVIDAAVCNEEAKDRLVRGTWLNDLFCVEWDVEPTQSITCYIVCVCVQNLPSHVEHRSTARTARCAPVAKGLHSRFVLCSFLCIKLKR